MQAASSQDKKVGSGEGPTRLGSFTIEALLLEASTAWGKRSAEIGECMRIVLTSEDMFGEHVHVALVTKLMGRMTSMTEGLER